MSSEQDGTIGIWQVVCQEAKRLVPFLAVTILLLFRDPNLPVVGFAIGVVALILMVAHLARLALFSYLDLEILVKQAATQPLASAIVAAAMLYFFAAIIQTIVALLR